MAQVEIASGKVSKNQPSNIKVSSVTYGGQTYSVNEFRSRYGGQFGGSGAGGSLQPTAQEQAAQASLVNRGAPAPTAQEQAAQASLVDRGVSRRVSYSQSAGQPTAQEQAAQASLVNRASVAQVRVVSSVAQLRDERLARARSSFVGRPDYVQDVGLFLAGPAVLGGALKFLGIGARAVGASKAVQSVAQVAARAPGAAKVAQGAGAAARAVSRVPAPVKIGAYIVGGVGTDVYFAGETQRSKEAQAGKLAGQGALRDFSKEQAKEFLESVNLRTNLGAFGGQVDKGKGEVETVKPGFGDDSLIGMGSRFVLGGVPGLTSIVGEDIARKAIEDEFKGRGISFSKADVARVLEAQKAVGVSSTIGVIVPEIVSEVVVGRTVAGKLRNLKSQTTDSVTRALLGRIVLPTAAAGAFEAGTQQYNVESLTSSKIDPLNIGIAAAFGAASAGGFSVANAFFTPRGFGKAVQVVGWGLDFPGEPAGDVAANLGYRALRKQQPSLRIPVFSFAGGGPVSFSEQGRGRAKGSTFTGTGSAIISSSSNIPVNRAPSQTFVSEPKETTKPRFPGNVPGVPVPSILDTPSNVPTDTFTDTFTDPLTFSFSETNIFSETAAPSVTNIFTPSMTNVPTITAGLPFPFLPPGRLGEGGGGGGRAGRIGYVDELALALGFGRAPRSRSRPLKQTRRAIRMRNTRVLTRRTRRAENIGFSIFGRATKAKGKRGRSLFSNFL